MQRLLTPTLALIVAGGLAAGIALARPASSDPAPAAAPAPAAGAAPEGGDDTDYRTGGRANGRTAGDRADGDRADGGGDASGGRAGGDGAPAAVAPSAATVTIEGFAFDGPAAVAPGATIEVTNLDGAPHTLTFRSGEVDTDTIGQGQTAVVTAPLAPGSYEFFCRIHPSMAGRIDVVDG